MSDDDDDDDDDDDARYCRPESVPRAQGGQEAPSPFSLPFLDLLPLSDANFFPVVALPRPSSTTRWQTQLVSVLRGSSSSWVPPLERRGEEWRAAAQKSLDAFVR